ncbi:MAG: magnesium/cobalt transporter CorA [bacterium]
MARFFHRMKQRVAQSPGTVVYHGEPKVDQVVVSVIDYDPQRLDEREVDDIGECFHYRDESSVTWINVTGLHDTDLLKRLGGHFGLHPLVQEDIVNTFQRPKLEDFETYLYIVCRMLHYKAETRRVESEQVSLVLGENFVLSFQERAGDVFEPVRERLRKGKGRIRKLSADYLAYALLDAVVDGYFLILEQYGEQLEALEEALLEHPSSELLHTIHELKREMILLRRSVWPLREVVSGLERAESGLVQEVTGPFLRDVYDHTIQVAEMVESIRDMLSGMQDLYLSSISNRMNEVMKVLTIISTIFVPMTFVAGIYGMNFEHMPELGWKWSYPIFWGVVCTMAGFMMGFFRRRRWL